jgi:hypothetical protein
MEIEVPFASEYGQKLTELELDGEAGTLAFHIGLLSENYENIARRRNSNHPLDRFLVGLATGSVAGLNAPDQMGSAIKLAFSQGVRPSASYSALLTDKRLGEALILAIDQITEGARGDLRDVTDGLVLLRHVGLESTARRAAIELMLLDRRG